MKGWLESQQFTQFGPAAQTPQVNRAVQAWNMMGAVIDWNALPLVCEILEIDDIELLVRQLVVIREFQQLNAEAEARVNGAR